MLCEEAEWARVGSMGSGMVKGAREAGGKQSCWGNLTALYPFLCNFISLPISETRADPQECGPIPNSLINNAIRIQYSDSVPAIFGNHNVGCGICYICWEGMTTSTSILSKEHGMILKVLKEFGKIQDIFLCWLKWRLAFYQLKTNAPSSAQCRNLRKSP